VLAPPTTPATPQRRLSLRSQDDPPHSSRRLSTVIPHVDPPSSGVILIRANPPTTFGTPDSVSIPVCVLPPTPPSAAKVKLSSTASLPSTPHSSPSESASQPAPPRRVRDQRFPAVRPTEQSIPTPAMVDFRDDTPFAHCPDRVLLSYCLSESHVHPLAAAAIA
jgi:hypothetical protein